MSGPLPGWPLSCLSICNYHVQAIAPLPASCLSICNYHVQAIAPLPASCLSICNYHVQATARLHAYLPVYLPNACPHCQGHFPAGRFPACLSANYHVHALALLSATTMSRSLPGCIACLPAGLLVNLPTSVACPGHCPAACFPVCLSANYHVHTVKVISRLAAFLPIYLPTTMSSHCLAAPQTCLSICQLPCSDHCLAVRRPTCLSVNCMSSHCPTAPQAYLSISLLVYHVQTNAQLHAFLSLYLPTTLSWQLPGCMLTCLSAYYSVQAIDRPLRACLSEFCNYHVQAIDWLLAFLVVYL